MILSSCVSTFEEIPLQSHGYLLSKSSEEENDLLDCGKVLQFCSVCIFSFILECF